MYALRERQEHGGDVVYHEGTHQDVVLIGLPNADQVLLKAQLTLEIYRIIKSRKLTRTQAGKVLEIIHTAPCVPADAESIGVSVIVAA